MLNIAKDLRFENAKNILMFPVFLLNDGESNSDDAELRVAI